MFNFCSKISESRLSVISGQTRKKISFAPVAGAVYTRTDQTDSLPPGICIDDSLYPGIFISLLFDNMYLFFVEFDVFGYKDCCKH